MRTPVPQDSGKPMTIPTTVVASHIPRATFAVRRVLAISLP